MRHSAPAARNPAISFSMAGLGVTDVKGPLPRWTASGSQPAGSCECPVVARLACLAADSVSSPRGACWFWPLELKNWLVVRPGLRNRT